MSRTVLPPIAAVRGGGVSLGVGTSAAAANVGMIVPGPVGPNKLEIQVYNGSGSSINVIFRAGGYQGAANGAANASYVTDQYQPFADASAGDLVVAVAGTSTTLFTDLDTSRFSQPDGSLWIDVSLATTVTYWAIQRPYMP